MNVPFFGPSTFKDHIEQDISFSPHEVGKGLASYSKNHPFVSHVFYPEGTKDEVKRPEGY